MLYSRTGCIQLLNTFILVLLYHRMNKAPPLNDVFIFGSILLNISISLCRMMRNSHSSAECGKCPCAKLIKCIDLLYHKQFEANSGPIFKLYECDVETSSPQKVNFSLNKIICQKKQYKLLFKVEFLIGLEGIHTYRFSGHQVGTWTKRNNCKKMYRDVHHHLTINHKMYVTVV